jgi:hypothetical protein
MQNYSQEPVEVLRQGLCGQRRVDDDVVSSAVILADRLSRLKTFGPMFEAISFSPDIEAMLAAHTAAAVN